MPELQIWFAINVVFVTLLIIFLFTHRAVTMARLEKDAERVRRKSKVRLIFGILTIVAFVAMVSSFVYHMKVNPQGTKQSALEVEVNVDK
ncbi:hypothetical protein PAECIP111893_03150 [Paenibacillus plantiphilus]|uniref:Uncharacterized protein n=1 Tax=Paenibacillus plantiphilus TaxID=2905650 RepID=A0ABN8GQA0_9BACL|nr:hypothetical protein [Paenibacillus plantiphilus]CAH1210146.1 hypothetical protein PAECIP111893_03150 [Paenibacillus plantiphilus]